MLRAERSVFQGSAAGEHLGTVRSDYPFNRSRRGDLTSGHKDAAIGVLDPIFEL
jgi:hypothetical protein